MPQYLFSVHHDLTEPKMNPEREKQSYLDTGAFNQRLIEGGHFIYANGISDPKDSILVDNREDRGIINHDRYIKGDRYLGGFWILSFDDDDIAKNWALEASKACNQIVEIRKFHN